MRRTIRGMEQHPKMLYCNLVHEIDEQVVADLEAQAGQVKAQHAAWNFCGWVEFDGTEWVEEIWCYGHIVETLRGPTARNVVEQANEMYGNA